MKISDRRLRISNSLKISDFSNRLGVLQHPQATPTIRLCRVSLVAFSMWGSGHPEVIRPTFCLFFVYM